MMRKMFVVAFSLVVCLATYGQVEMNQLGFYDKAPKKAAVIANPDVKEFKIVTAGGEEVFKGQLSEPMPSKNSSLTVCQADFTNFTTPGEYRLVAGNQESGVFTIGDNVFSDVAKAVLKGFYYQRVSEPLEEEHAGRWARPAGHPDTQVEIHPSAATPQRPAGTIISSPGGWYDAGDYNKYIVNSGITTATLLSAYEDFPQYYQQLTVNIPESGNGIPDILNETLCNLRWMLTMQDPNDGGVYHKCTNAGFDGMVMPDVTKDTRYVVQKGTAATLDFAAVMAQAARVFGQFPNELPGLADSCMVAAKYAWDWALQNPNIMYNQFAMNREFKPEVFTGAYGDNNVDDEWFWAASEMYAATSEPVYKIKISEYINDSLRVPSWDYVYALGAYTLLRINDPEFAPFFTEKVVGMADGFVNSVSTNAFGVVMGQKPSDFVWGSNSEAANQGILLINAYRLTNDMKYLDAALTNVDYLLGRNATGYCFVTGFGSKRVMFPHHRPSAADGIDDPVPGLLSGGPNPGMQDRNDGCNYVFTEPETAFVDVTASYASNEIAINWNAPVVYLFNAIEAEQANWK
ncbi:MAG: glycoside hydrolase family 9 protein [Dysgonamonadaceae bacterium]|nr:glycoside hydrolase family 9 protein [Dysgonamonadaceae bacterium]